MPILEVSELNVRFATPDGEVQAVNSVTLYIDKGEALGIVGESGSGKSQVFMAVMGLLASNGWAEGAVRFNGQDILGLPAGKLNAVRGARMSMIFQDPMTSLNPYLSIARQMTEVLIQHKGMNEGQARTRGIEMMDLVRIPDAKRRFSQYPHEFSGGMRQRVMIAMALLCEPELLIADEPTTALDVTVQAQILELVGDIRRELDTAVIMITHDLGVIASTCDRVLVMYGGGIMEIGSVRDVFYDPQHPYTHGLLTSMPRLDKAGESHLNAIPGQPPNLQHMPPGCPFSARCTYLEDRCTASLPPLTGFADGRAKACVHERLEPIA